MKVMLSFIRNKNHFHFYYRFNIRPKFYLMVTLESTIGQLIVNCFHLPEERKEFLILKKASHLFLISRAM